MNLPELIVQEYTPSDPDTYSRQKTDYTFASQRMAPNAPEGYRKRRIKVDAHQGDADHESYLALCVCPGPGHVSHRTMEVIRWFADQSDIETVLATSKGVYELADRIPEAEDIMDEMMVSEGESIDNLIRFFSGKRVTGDVGILTYPGNPELKGMQNRLDEELIGNLTYTIGTPALQERFDVELDFTTDPYVQYSSEENVSFREKIGWFLGKAFDVRHNFSPLALTLAGINILNIAAAHASAPYGPAQVEYMFKQTVAQAPLFYTDLLINPLNILSAGYIVWDYIQNVSDRMGSVEDQHMIDETLPDGFYDLCVTPLIGEFEFKGNTLFIPENYLSHVDYTTLDEQISYILEELI